MHSPMCTRADMGEAGTPRLSVASEGDRASDVAQRPQREREIQHCPGAGVVAEVKGQIVVASGLKQGERAFQMLARFSVLSGEPMRHSGCTVSDSGLGRIGSRLDVAEEGPGMGPHRRQLSAQQTADPQAVIGRQALKRVLVASGEFASPCEGFGRLGRPIAARRDQRVAVGDVQMPPLARRAPRLSPPPCPAISIALPRWAIASWKAERRRA